MPSPMIAGAASAPAESARLEFRAPALELPIERDLATLRRWSASTLRWTRRDRRMPHPLLVDRDGAWAWSRADRYAPATRVDDLDAWLRVQSGQRLALWLAADLLGDRPDARRIAYDAAPLLRQAAHHGVRVESVTPWWRHAGDEARRCVPRLDRAATGQVCVVEGQRLACLVSAHGVLAEVRHLTLPDATLAALEGAMRDAGLRAQSREVATVVVGQGLVGGSRTHGLDALVLGRLDGPQPPQWLRPHA